jgi:hypothetical protein
MNISGDYEHVFASHSLFIQYQKQFAHEFDRGDRGNIAVVIRGAKFDNIRPDELELPKQQQSLKQLLKLTPPGSGVPVPGNSWI